jgi:hypothetical protein
LLPVRSRYAYGSPEKRSRTPRSRRDDTGTELLATGLAPPTRRPMHEVMRFRRSRPTRRPINQHPLSISPLNDANLMAGLHAGDRVDTKPTEQGGGIESL